MAERAQRGEGTGQLGSSGLELRPAAAAARRDESGEPGQPARRDAAPGSSGAVQCGSVHRHGRTATAVLQRSSRAQPLLKIGQLLKANFPIPYSYFCILGY